MNPRLLLPIIGAVQGALLYWLYRAAKDHSWPATEPVAFGLFAALAVGLTAIIYLSQATGMPLRRRALLIALMALAYALLGAYAGWVSGSRVFGEGPSHAANALAAAILGFMLVPLVSGWNAAPQENPQGQYGRWNYHLLYDIAWRNAVLCLTSGVLTGIFWMVLLAGAGLLKSLGLGAFFDLIKEPEFFIPASCIAAGEAFALGLSRAELLVSLRHFWMTLTAWFLPLLLCFAVVWVIALPFTGPDELFSTRMAAFFLLWFAALCINFLNSAWQDGNEAVYGTRLQVLVAALWLTLPVVVGVAGIALQQRIAQYGWTDDRIWAAFVWLLAAGYVTGYALSWLPALKRRGWMAGVGNTNITVALVMCTGLVLLLSPVLDPRRVSVNDQMARLRAGLVKPDTFDYNYLRLQAGRWGTDALKVLAEEQGDERTRDIADRAKQALALRAARGLDGPHNLERDPARSRIRMIPKETVLADALLDRIRDPKADYQERQCLAPERKCIAWVRDLNKDGKDDVLLLSYQNPNDFPTVAIYSGGDDWKRVSTIHGSVRAEKWVAAMEAGKVVAEFPKWPDLVVDGVKSRVSVGQ